MSNNLVVATKRIHQEIDARQGEFKAALPDHIPVTKFRRVLMTAISKDADLLAADRVTLFQAAMDCAQDGLLPDGREAVLLVFKTKMKRNGVEVYVNAVTYMPMVRGILKRMRNTGMVTAPTAQLVYRNDKFRYWVDDDGQHLQHDFDVFGQRGEIVGVYARAKTTDDELHIEVMSKAEVEYIRHTFSKQPNGQMWSKSWGEAARKTVLKRLAKVLPCSTDLELTIDRGDTDMEDIDTAPPRPSLADFSKPDPEPEQEEEPEGELYRIEDGYGCLEYEGGDQKLALAALQTLLDNASDEAEYDAISESNPDMMALITPASGVQRKPAAGTDATRKDATGSDQAGTPSPADAPPSAGVAGPDAASPPLLPGASQHPAGTYTKEKGAPYDIFYFDPKSSERRWYSGVTAWCDAVAELAKHVDHYNVWDSNSSEFSRLLKRCAKSPDALGKLMAMKDHFAGLHKDAMNPPKGAC